MLVNHAGIHQLVLELATRPLLTEIHQSGFNALFSDLKERKVLVRGAFLAVFVLFFVG